jgi:FtsH-binding integral membrane protein
LLFALGWRTSGPAGSTRGAIVVVVILSIRGGKPSATGGAAVVLVVFARATIHPLLKPATGATVASATARAKALFGTIRSIGATERRCGGEVLQALGQLSLLFRG